MTKKMKRQLLILLGLLTLSCAVKAQTPEEKNAAVPVVSADYTQQLEQATRKNNDLEQKKKDKKVELKSGGYIPSGNFVYSGIGSTYYVSYHFAGHGVIVYDYTTIDNWHRVKEAMVGTLVLAGVIYMIVQTGGAAAPALIPRKRQF